MRRLLLSLVAVVALQPLAAGAEQRAGVRTTSEHELRTADFTPADSTAAPYGRAPGRHGKAANLPVMKILPATGSFVDEPGLPYLMGFNFMYPYSVVALDYPSMTETAIVEDAVNFPSSVYLREGNFEGTAFSDNNRGSLIMQGSFDVSGNKNWQYTQFILNTDIRKRPLRSVYDERENRVYALSAKVMDKKEEYCFISYSPTDLFDIEIINQSIPGSYNCSSMAWDPRDGSVIGVSVAGDVVRFDKKTGQPTVIFSTGLPQNHVYFGGLVYSPRHNGFIWAWLPTKDGRTVSQDFYLIDTEKKTCTLIQSIPNSEQGLHQMSSLMVNEQYVNPLAPAPATVTSEGTSASGAKHSIEITLPTKLENGSPIGGNLQLVVRIGGTTNAEGTKTTRRHDQAPGSKVTIDLGSLSDGMHRVSIYTVTADNVWSRRTNLAKFVGEDTPVAPTNVKLTETKLTWDPVTVGVKGQDLSGKSITYEVWVDEKVVGTTSSTSFDMNFDPVELLSHMAAVSAINAGKKSALGFSDRISMGKYRSIPAHFVPGVSDVLFANSFDMDADERTWEYDAYGEAWRKVAGSTSSANDDWLFMPPLNFDDDDALYDISFELRTGDFDSEIELMLADQAVAERVPGAISFKANTKNDFQTFSTRVNAKGIKYLCFHPVKQRYDFLLKNIKVTNTGGDLNSPEAVTELKATPAIEGETTATIEFTAPTKTVSGAAINAATDITFKLTGETVIEASVTAKPGQKVTKEVSAAEGIAVLTVTPYIDGKPGMPANVKYFSGEDVPGFVKDFKVSLGKDPCTVYINYKSPCHDGHNGGWSSTDYLVYYLMMKKLGGSQWTRYNSVAYTDIEFTINPTQPQSHVLWGIMTENQKGSSKDWPEASITCGPAFRLPMRETMPGGSPQYGPIITETPTEEYIGGTGFADPSQIKPEYAVPAGRVIGLMPPANELPGKAMVVLPYFSTENVVNPALNIRVLLDPECVAQADLYANVYGKERIKIGSWNAQTRGHGFTNLHFPLPDALKNQKWVQLFVEGTFEGGPDRRYVAIERYTVSESHGNDFSLLSASTPANMRVNREATIRASVVNNSTVPKAAPEVKLSYTDGAGVLTETTLTPASTDMIGVDEEREYTYKFTPTADAMGEMVFHLSLPDDDVLEGNHYDATGNVIVGDAVFPPYLKAKRRADAPRVVDLEWGYPSIFNGTDNIESMPAFSIDENLGSFLNIDLDKSLTYSWENWDFPNEESPHAFIVFDDRHPSIPAASRSILKAHSGHQFLLALSPLNYVSANDWLISPEVKPGSDISFWLSTVSTSYGADMVGVYWSKGSTNPDDFEFLAYKRKDTEGWEQLSYTLPEEAKRFAIKYYSNDTFGIMLDDISYIPAEGLATLEGFEVVRDSILLARLHTPILTHTDEYAPTSQTHHYRVTAFTKTADGNVKRCDTSPTAIVEELAGINDVIADGTITVSGRRIIVKGNGATVAAATLDGKVVPAESADGYTTIYSVEPGVYVVTVGKSSAKIMVR